MGGGVLPGEGGSVCPRVLFRQRTQSGEAAPGLLTLTHTALDV